MSGEERRGAQTKNSCDDAIPIASTGPESQAFFWLHHAHMPQLLCTRTTASSFASLENLQSVRGDIAIDSPRSIPDKHRVALSSRHLNPVLG
jgi:hypothetical protein